MVSRSTLLITTAAVLLTVHAHAASGQVYSFDIPAEPLSQALTDFSQSSAQQILFSEDVVKGKKAPALHGNYTAAKAIEMLLSGSGLRVRSDANGVLMIARSDSAGLDPQGLETVFVSAQRRAEEAQNVPVSMTVLSAQTLQAYRVETISDLSRLSPSLLVAAFSYDSPTIAIRGANNTFNQIGVSKPVAVVVDDVFVSRASAAVFNLFDMASVNVLNGPQGTLFGRNVTGGAIVIETKKPVVDSYLYSAQLSGGNYGNIEADALINVPLGNGAAWNVAGSIQHRDGYGRDRITGREQDDINSKNLRTHFLFAVTPNLEITLGGDYSRDENGGRTLSSTSLGDDGNRRTSEIGFPQDFKREIAGGDVKALYHTGLGEVTSITAFRHSRSGENYSGVGANYTFLTSGTQGLVTDHDEVGTFTQELRFVSRDWSFGNFVTGFYFLDEFANRQLTKPAYAAITGKITGNTQNLEDVHTISYAPYADITVHILDGLDASAGVRYTYDHKTASLTYHDFIKPVNDFAVTNSTNSWSELTPRGVLTWHVTSDAIVYGSVTKGFTAGGFNTDASSVKAFALTFAPETVTSYEIGTKTNWFDDRLRLNVDLFKMKYNNKQELVFNSTNGILDIINAAKATSSGLDLQVAYKLVDWLTLNADYSVLWTRYDSFVVGSLNNTGNHLSSAPPNKLTLSADWRYPLGDFGKLIGAVSYSWIDSYNTGAAADPRLQIPDYGLINANLGWADAEDHYRITVWARNLTNKGYILTRSTQTITAEYLGEPRMIGVTLTVNP